MNIYDVTFYGVYYPLREENRIQLFESLDGMIFENESELLFKAYVLKTHNGKTDVVKLEFTQGIDEYECLNEASFFDRDLGVWQESANTELSQKFLELFEKVKKKEAKTKSIFDVKFYGVSSQFAVEKPTVQISTNKDDLKINPNYNNILFEGTVLREFKGKQYVLKLESELGEEYILLFEPRETFDPLFRRWYHTDSNKICEKVIECYIKHINS